jgi:hypothetical protein
MPGPKVTSSGRSSIITIVHWQPSAVSEAATSHAMKDPPINTTLVSAAAAAPARIASALPNERR